MTFASHSVSKINTFMLPSKKVSEDKSHISDTFPKMSTIWCPHTLQLNVTPSLTSD